MKLPTLDIQPVPQWQKERLDRWLSEWKIDRILIDEGEREKRNEVSLSPASASRLTDTQGPTGQDVKDMIAPVSKEPDMESGQIRLLSPDISGAECRPVYLAVLNEPKPGAFLAAPYSRFAEPATDGELLTGRQDSCLRVLCLWNARHVPKEVIEKSWSVDKLTDDEVSSALAVIDCITNEMALPADLKERVGSPVQHPLDPRHLYQQEEMEMMETILENRKSSVRSFPYEIKKRQDLPLAAESLEPYDTDSSSTKKRSSSDAGSGTPDAEDEDL